jgi:TRAP-type C4-dicarboxylate transport system permease small subunit
LHYFYKTLHKVIDIILFTILAAMVTIVTAQIFTRFILFYSLPWSEELSRYLFAYLILLGACVGVREKNQIAIDVIDNFIKGNKAAVLAVIQNLIQIAVIIILFYSSLKLMKVGARQMSPAMGVKMSLIYLCFPIGFSLIFLELSLNTAAAIAKVLSLFKPHNSQQAEGRQQCQ